MDELDGENLLPRAYNATGYLFLVILWKVMFARESVMRNVWDSLVSKAFFGVGKFSEFMANHILCYRHRHVVFTIMHHETNAVKK